jgi:hypothetical protein
VLTVLCAGVQGRSERSQPGRLDGLPNVDASADLGFNQTFLPEPGKRTLDCPVAHFVPLHERALGRQQLPLADLPRLDHGAQDVRELAPDWRTGVVVDCHQANVDRSPRATSARPGPAWAYPGIMQSYRPAPRLPVVRGHGRAGALVPGGHVDGTVRALSIGWTTETPDGPKRNLISLFDLRQHCRAERVEEVLADLAMLCSDVQAAREGVAAG